MPRTWTRVVVMPWCPCMHPCCTYISHQQSLPPRSRVHGTCVALRLVLLLCLQWVLTKAGDTNTWDVPIDKNTPAAKPVSLLGKTKKAGAAQAAASVGSGQAASERLADLFGRAPEPKLDLSAGQYTLAVKITVPKGDLAGVQHVFCHTQHTTANPLPNLILQLLCSCCVLPRCMRVRAKAS